MYTEGFPVKVWNPSQFKHLRGIKESPAHTPTIGTDLIKNRTLFSFFNIGKHQDLNTF